MSNPTSETKIGIIAEIIQRRRRKRSRSPERTRGGSSAEKEMELGEDDSEPNLTQNGIGQEEQSTVERGQQSINIFTTSEPKLPTVRKKTKPASIFRVMLISLVISSLCLDLASLSASHAGYFAAKVECSDNVVPAGDSGDTHALGLWIGWAGARSNLEGNGVKASYSLRNLDPVLATVGAMVAGAHFISLALYTYALLVLLCLKRLQRLRPMFLLHKRRFAGGTPPSTPARTPENEPVSLEENSTSTDREQQDSLDVSMESTEPSQPFPSENVPKMNEVYVGQGEPEVASCPHRPHMKIVCIGSLSLAAVLCLVGVMGFYVAVYNRIGDVLRTLYEQRLSVQCNHTPFVMVDYAYAMTTLAALAQALVGLLFCMILRSGKRGTTTSSLGCMTEVAQSYDVSGVEVIEEGRPLSQRWRHRRNESHGEDMTEQNASSCHAVVV